ncbi:hypothetical protein DFH28DRAFT_1121591 [Melampsora americana]|nr:hypothetical protein DFH28DRAFT_1121591 [Melampsora americana]
MDQPRMPFESLNGSIGIESSPSNGFPPQHIKGQCVHRWPSTISKTTPPQMVFYHQAIRCKWHQQRGGPIGPSLYNPSAHGANPVAFMTPSPGSRPTFPLQNLSQSDRSVLETTKNDSGFLVSDSLEYVSNGVSKSEANGSVNMICEDLHPQLNSDSEPSKKDKQVELDISIGQHKLQAGNLTSNVPTNESDLAHLTPKDPVNKAMAALMLKYSTAKNNTSEGWRVYKQDDLTKVMQRKQANDYFLPMQVSNPNSVTVDIPHNMEGFKWVDLKNPLVMQTPTSTTKRAAYDTISNFNIGGIAEAQGYNIELDPYNVDCVRTNATMDKYMVFALVQVQSHDEARQILLQHDIEFFDAFLYPELTNMDAMVEMGIKRGTAMRLMNCAH